MITEIHGSDLELKELTVSYNIIGVNMLWDLEKFVKFADLQYFRHEFATLVRCNRRAGTGKKEVSSYQDCHYCWICA
jgi:hypothetical protein